MHMLCGLGPLGASYQLLTKSNWAINVIKGSPNCVMRARASLT